MKSRYIAALSLALAGTVWAADTNTFKDQKDRSSYALGMNIGKSFHQSDLDLNLDQLLQGIRAAMAGGTNALLNEKDQMEAVRALQQEVRTRQEEKRKIGGEKNKIEGEKFLAENGKKPGVITLPSGLQYKVIKEGTGPMPKSTDQVKCNYRGTLIDGTEFDSSAKHGGQPSTFHVTGVIKGWVEALQMMKVGSKWELYIPSNLAYAERGSGAMILPNATLIFDLDLLEIVPPAQPAQQAPAVTSDIIKVPSAEEMKKGAKIEVIKPGSTNYPPNPETAKPAPTKK
jgi:FKBP-type peptidyl-prolyl cis-trans isomerase